MELICISDTHSKHQKLHVPKGDVLIHTGDVTEGGTKREVLDFLEWFSQQPHAHKIFIAGNHDFFLENFPSKPLAKNLPKNVHYLNESELYLSGVRFWGSPITPCIGDWAFSGKSHGRNLWQKMPNQFDVLLTHVPPYGVLDTSTNKKPLGSRSLLRKTIALKPKLHIFGHMHENYGKVKRGETVFVNAATFSHNGKLMNPPIKITI